MPSLSQSHADLLDHFQGLTTPTNDTNTREALRNAESTEWPQAYDAPSRGAENMEDVGPCVLCPVRANA